ncbi:AbrB/MazE/SpoVT family DNA-binding domain-containing protein [Candidatus Uhrbacteria bacterium]|nr:AbrB/MazE/SpoVT family DNA-binding domain-containing protein [Candidatus Uhrbacteria bacterium]
MTSKKCITGVSVRKLSKVAGGKSYSMTIPSDIVRAFGWKEHQKLVVSRVGRHIVIKDWRK